MGSSMDGDQLLVNQETAPVPKPQPRLSHSLGGFPSSTFPLTLAPMAVPLSGENPVEILSLGPNSHIRTSSKPIRPKPILPVPPSSKMAELNLNQTTPAELLPLALKLSPASSDEQPPPSTRPSAFQAMPGNFSSGGDSIISVA
jgi:hypothetical protein